MRISVLLFSLIFLFFNETSIAKEGKTCVLSFFDEDTEAYKFVSLRFSNNINTNFINKATPDEIVDCLNGKYKEVVWISHSTRLFQKNLLLPTFPLDPNHSLPLSSRYFSLISEQINIFPNKLRILFCGVRKGSSQRSTSMDALAHYLRDNGTIIDFATINVLASFLKGRDITSLSSPWLDESVDAERLLELKNK